MEKTALMKGKNFLKKRKCSLTRLRLRLCEEKKEGPFDAGTARANLRLRLKRV